jgi:hypothetical protein
VAVCNRQIRIRDANAAVDVAGERHDDDCYSRQGKPDHMLRAAVPNPLFITGGLAIGRDS